MVASAGVRGQIGREEQRTLRCAAAHHHARYGEVVHDFGPRLKGPDCLLPGARAELRFTQRLMQAVARGSKSFRRIGARSELIRALPVEARLLALPWIVPQGAALAAAASARGAGPSRSPGDPSGARSLTKRSPEDRVNQSGSV